jgi:hypothetical protein
VKTCHNPEHKEPQPATHVLVDKYRWLNPRFLCDACTWILDNSLVSLGPQEVQELGDWEEEQLSPEEKRREERLEYGDREYHRQKDEGLI